MPKTDAEHLAAIRRKGYVDGVTGDSDKRWVYLTEEARRVYAAGYREGYANANSSR